MLDTLVRHTNMVRLSLATVLVTLAVGCTGLIDGGAGGGTPEERAAKDAWITKALPRLTESCTACHSGQQANIDFLTGAGDLEIRDRIIAYTPGVVNFDAVQSSRLVTKGPHNGPAFTTEQASDVLDWLNAEKAAVPDPGDGGPILVTAQFSPIYCVSGAPGTATCPINTVDLTPLGVTGGKITFVATALSSGLYLSNLNAEGATDGLFIEHPLFTSYVDQGADAPKVVVDNIDRFFSVKMNLMANIKEQIAGGTAAFVGFGAGAADKLEIRFKAIKTYQVETGTGTGSGGGGGGGGCKQLASFKANAAGPLNAACANCHAGGNNPNAKAAMNIDGAVSGDDAMVLLACNQVRTRINFLDTNKSGFFVAPNPADLTSHMFKFNQADFNTFKAAVDPWVQAEKTSP